MRMHHPIVKLAMSARGEAGLLAGVQKIDSITIKRNSLTVLLQPLMHRIKTIQRIGCSSCTLVGKVLHLPLT